MDRSLLANATSQDDAPTPGYMLNEISKATTASYQINVQIQDYLVSRLATKHHNVKYKSLVIIKHICRTGSPEFKRAMTRKVDAIKECLQFKGNPDPLRGDELNKRVRDSAREALDAIFDSQMPTTTSAVAAANRIQGIGNDYTPSESTKQSSTGFLNNFVSNISSTIYGDGTNDIAYAGHPGANGSFVDSGKYSNSNPNNNTYSGPDGSSSSSAGMVGIGNPNFKDPRNQEKGWLQKASEYAGMSSVGSKPKPVENVNPDSDYQFATNRGSGAYGINQEAYSPHVVNGFGNQPPSSNWGSVVPDIPQGPIGSGRAGHAASDGAYEKSLIESLCEPGGLKPIPSEAKLKDFLIAATTLSPDLVGECLIEVLNSDNWQSKVKALIVISHLVVARDCAGHLEWWISNLEEIKALTSDSKASVRVQANKTLKVVVGDSDDISPAGSVTPPPSNGNNNNLLDFIDSNPPPVTSYSVPTVVPVATLPNTTDMFAGLSLNSSVSSAQVPLQPAAPITSSFDFLSATTPTNNNLPVSNQTYLPTQGNFPPSTSPKPSADFSIFDDLTVLKPSISSSEPPLGVTQESSGFNFLGASTTLNSGNSAQLISSAFSEPIQEKSTSSAFQEFSLKHEPVPQYSSTQVRGYTNAPNPQFQQVPLNNMMNRPTNGAPMGYPPQGVYQAYPPAPGYPNYPQGHSPMSGIPQNTLAPGMLNPTAPRKNIPTTEGSGFSFLSGTAPGPTKTESSLDSFSFVNDAMNNMKK